MEEIKVKHNFKIPQYVLEEIGTIRKDKLRALIRIAEINERITAEQATELIEAYCK